MIAKKVLFGLILPAATLSTTLAIPRTYDVGAGSSVTANTSVNNGLAIRTQLASGLSSQLFDLENGQSKTFNFFSIWTDETTVDADDTVEKAITARLDFDSPDITAQIPGITFSATIGSLSGGGVLWNDALKWNDSVTVSLPDRVFTVTLSDAVFDLGLNGTLGNSPAMITATIKQISSGGTTLVPEAGSTVALLGVGLGAMAMLRRKTA